MIYVEDTEKTFHGISLDKRKWDKLKKIPIGTRRCKNNRKTHTAIKQSGKAGEGWAVGGWGDNGVRTTKPLQKPKVLSYGKYQWKVCP